MRLNGELAERLREVLSAAALLTMIACLRSANAQQVDAQQVEAQQVEARSSDRPGAEAYGAVAQPADPEELSRLRYAGKSFRDWQELFLTDLEPATRLKALPALKKFGRYGYASEAAETIAAAFADDDGELVNEAINAAASIGADAVPKLVELCKATPGQTRHSCAQALGKMGPKAAAAVPSLFELLSTIEVKSEDDWLELHCLLSALKEIGPAQIPTLLERLDSPDRNTRVLAAYLTGRLGPGQPGSAMRQLTIGLRKAFKDDDAAARAVVGAALWQWAPTDEKAMLALRDAIESDERRVAGAIAAAIATTFQAYQDRGRAPYAAEAAALVSPGGAVSEGALVNGVSLLGAAIRTPAFLQIFSDRQAARAEEPPPLPGWEFPGVVPLNAGETDASFAFQVFRGLNAAQGRAKPLVPELIALAETDRENVVLATVDILGDIGPDAEPALPTLKKIAERRQKQGAAPNDDKLLRATLNSIAKIESPAPALVRPIFVHPAP